MPFELRRFAGPATFTEQLDGLRIAHLTDLHVGPVTPHRVQLEAVARTNAQRPDAVVLTGDFVCHSQLWLDALTDVVKRFEAPVFAVLGNHDHWSGAREVRWALRRAHAEVLDNAWTTIELRHQPLQIVGLDDAYTGHADRARATKGLDPTRATLGLSHIAEEADGLWSCGVPLVLSGHTHAGQVTVARINELILGRLVGHRYIHGLYGRRAQPQAGVVYVGAGIGAAVVPLRLGERAQREIAVFELGAEVGEFVEDHSEQRPKPGRAPAPERLARRAAVAAYKSARRRAAARLRGVVIDDS